MGRHRGRQRDHSITLAGVRSKRWGMALRVLGKRRATHLNSMGSVTTVLLRCAQTYLAERNEFGRYLLRSNRISTSDFLFNFNALTDACSLSMFRFTKHDLLRVANIMGWNATCTIRNRYSCDPLLVTCVILRRLTTPARWRDMELTFGKHAGQLSEIFWEGLEAFLHTRQHLITSNMDSAFFAQRAELYAMAVKDKCHALDNCVGFIDGTVIAIARPTRGEVQHVAYNGHKRKHALKYQAVTSPDGLVLHAAGTIEGRRHDWILYCRSGLEESLPELTVVDGKQYCLYGDSGYNRRLFLEVPFQGSDLPSYETAFNLAMSGRRVTVEWYFKEVKLYWSTTDYKRKMRTGESPVGALYIAAMLLTNFRNCVYPNTIAQYFRCDPPSLEKYVEHKEQ